jgi:hypothetical protein
VNSSEHRRLQTIEEKLREVAPETPERATLLRSALRLRRDLNARRLKAGGVPERGDRCDRLDALAATALSELGSIGEPPTWCVGSYDADRFGPILGVSDDGDAAETIVRAFMSTPKAASLREAGLLSSRTLGACVDAERITAAGELLVGPDEWARILEAADGVTGLSTNVGTVVLPRFFRPRPAITVTASDDPVDVAVEALTAEFHDYMGGSGRPARAVTVFVGFRAHDFRKRQKVRILRQLQEVVASGRVCDPEVHRIGLLQRVADRPYAAIGLAIDVAAEAGVAEVMIEGEIRYEARDQLTMPGLLTYLAPGVVNRVLEKATTVGVTVVAKNEIDVATAARTVWAALSTARGMGAHLGKFGLFPLTIEQQLEAIRTIRPWFPTWTPAPSFYVDRPALTSGGVFEERDLTEVAIGWVRGAADAGADVVLFDSPDRTPAPAGTGTVPYREDRGRRLVKRHALDPAGVLTFEDVGRILAVAQCVTPPVRTLWAGGLSARQAYELSGMGAFGLFTTSTTARRIGVRNPEADPAATSDLEPTFYGVLGVAMVVEAGFLRSAAQRSGNRGLARSLIRAVEPVLDVLDRGLPNREPAHAGVAVLDDLRAVLEPAWRSHLSTVQGGET